MPPYAKDMASLAAMRRRARSSSRGHTDRNFRRSAAMDSDAMPRQHSSFFDNLQY
jgi:hypothetical protein